MKYIKLLELIEIATLLPKKRVPKTAQNSSFTLQSDVRSLFKAGRHEVGCSEVGKHDALSIDHKYLNDGMSKLPKTLPDMLFI